MYVAGLTLESYSNLDPLATVATDDKAKIFRAENAYASAMEFARQTVPKDMAWLLISRVLDQRVAHKNCERLFMLDHILELTHSALIIEYTKILLQHYNPILVEILESNSSTTLERDYKLMDSLRRALDNLPASSTQVTSIGDKKETLSAVKQEIVKSLDAILQTWQKDFRSARMHSITMRRAVATTSRTSSSSA
ncbi:hypothetical protein CPB86DRAFT_795882 [Serendipita vermifera]|nr:hypothetical protein CPB86DRAFT_795882 [Serendipita vermifera]